MNVDFAIAGLILDKNTYKYMLTCIFSTSLQLQYYIKIIHPVQGKKHIINVVKKHLFDTLFAKIVYVV